MAKRFIDTGFLDQKWIRKLSPTRKAFLIYLMLRCDNAGVIELDMEDAEFWIGQKIGDPLQFLPAGYLIQVGDDKFFMPKFLKWQYPNFPHSKVHQQKQAIQILIDLQIFDEETNNFSKSYLNLTQNLPNSWVIGNAIANGSVDVKEENKRKPINIRFATWWDTYDKKVGDKAKCQKKWEKLKDSEREACMNHTPVYVKSTPDKTYRKDPGTYLNQRGWEDEIIPHSTQRSSVHQKFNGKGSLPTSPTLIPDNTDVFSDIINKTH